jgi:hypothetical protein
VAADEAVAHHLALAEGRKNIVRHAASL